MRTLRQVPKSANGGGASAAAESEFRHQQRKTDQQQTQKIDNQKCPASVLNRQLGKRPEIIETDGRPARGQHDDSG